jgi:hypothetical protein
MSKPELSWGICVYLLSSSSLRVICNVYTHQHSPPTSVTPTQTLTCAYEGFSSSFMTCRNAHV